VPILVIVLCTYPNTFKIVQTEIDIKRPRSQISRLPLHSAGMSALQLEKTFLGPPPKIRPHLMTVYERHVQPFMELSRLHKFPTGSLLVFWPSGVIHCQLCCGVF
jgi:hypothetical protein